MIHLRRILLVIGIAVILMGGAVTARAAEPDDLILRVTCRANGEVPGDGTLTFVLWDEGRNVLQRVINLRDHASFAPLRFFHAGCYVYYITQEGGGSLDIVYDTAVYQVVVQVTEAQGRLAAQITDLNRVSGDPVGEAQVLEVMGADGVPAFENGFRSVTALPTLAGVPQTGDKSLLWLVAVALSGLGLLKISRKQELHR